MNSALTRTFRLSVVGTTCAALLALTGCGASDSAEETCERFGAYINEMENFIPVEQEGTPEEMASALREMSDQMQEIRDDASDEELASSLDALTESYDTLHAAFEESDDEQSRAEIMTDALHEIDVDALAEAGETLDSRCDLS